MNTEFMEFRDILATLAEADPELDYIPVHSDEGFVTLDDYACHYIHREENQHATLRLFLLEGEETITSKSDRPSFTYYWTSGAWCCADSTVKLSSEGLAKFCVHHLFDLAKRERQHS